MASAIVQLSVAQKNKRSAERPWISVFRMELTIERNSSGVAAARISWI
jgi:hypothetical protein